MAVRNRRTEEETPPVHNNVIEAPITPRRLTVSESLRGRRIECGLDVDYVAQILKIRPAVLVAIESGKFDELPGPAYAVGFVRSYATYLGLDAEALVVRFKTETAEIARRPQLEFPLPIRDSRVPTGPLLIVCVLLAALTYAGWYYFSSTPSELAGLTPAVPDRLLQLLKTPPPPKPGADTASTAPMQATAPAPVAPTPAPDAAAPQPAPTAAPAVAAAQPAAPQPATPQAAAPPATSTQATSTQGTSTQAASTQPAVDGVPPVENKPTAGPAVAALPPAPDLTQPAVTADQPKQPDNTYGAPEGQARVVLHATADSWVQVRDKGSNLLFTRVLKPGEHYNVPNQPGLTLIAGNAGGIDITVDGMEAPRLGELGRVARNVSLDPDHLLGAVTHAN
jgi:cytoskeletal protein RodZ